MRTTSWATRLLRAHRDLRAAADAGVTLVEVIVAAVLLMTLSTSVLALILQSQRAQVDNRSRVTAASLAAREIDIVRQVFGAADDGPATIAAAGLVTNPNPLDGGVPGEPLEVDGQEYTVVRSVQWDLTDRTGASACEGGSRVDYPTLTVTVTVTWPDMGSTRPVVSQATLAPDKGDGPADTAGFIAVAVNGADGQPSAGRTVRVAGGSESHVAATDSSGCAVVEVAPAAGGTSYMVSVDDPGYVDMSGNQAPSKATGTVHQGALNNEVSFTYDRAGTVRVILVDEHGASVTPPPGATVTLVASQYTGVSPERTFPLTGAVTPITGLWPTTYGAYIGASPIGGYPSVALPPGGDVEVQVRQVVAELPLQNLPAGTSHVVAVATGHGDCATALASTQPASAPSTTMTLTPGTWDFFVRGATFGCSPGPAAVEIGEGANDPLVWGRGAFTVVDGPPGALWAVDASLTGQLTSCPTGANAALAQDVTGARGGVAELPAGVYYLFITDGPVNGACVAPPTGTFNPAAVPYGALNTVTWSSTSTVTVTGVERDAGNAYPTVVLSQTEPAGLSCTSTTVLPAGSATLLQGPPSRSSDSLDFPASPGTWYVYGWDKGSSGWFGRDPVCRHAGTVHVGWGSGPLTIDYSTSVRPVVGP